MYHLPTEIIQHISSFLLPRYQCRLAITSTWCYDNIYNDLLRWHAKKYNIATPKWKLIIGPGNIPRSLLLIEKRMICYETFKVLFKNGHGLSSLVIMDFITCLQTHLDDHIHNKTVNGCQYISSTIVYYNAWLYHKYLIKPSYRKYLHKKFLLALVNLRSVPYINNTRVKAYMSRLLDDESFDIATSCDHLRRIFV